MRRFGSVLLVAAALMPSALALGFASADWEAIRCAARCGHEVRSGAACCPAGATGGPSFSNCPSGDSAPARTAVLPPSILAVATQLTPPSREDVMVAPESLEPGSMVPDPPEHVPLALS